MDIEKIMLEVESEFGSSGLNEGIYADFAREVAMRAVATERERCAIIALSVGEEERPGAYTMCDVVAERIRMPNVKYAPV